MPSGRLRSGGGRIPERVAAVVALSRLGERDRHRTLRGRSSSPPHGGVRRCRVDVGFGRVVGRSGFPFGNLLSHAPDLVESVDFGLDAGRCTGVALGASGPRRGGSSPLADTSRFAGLIDVYTTLATSDSVMRVLKRRGLDQRAGPAVWRNADNRGSSRVHGRRRNDADDDDHRDGSVGCHGDRADAGGHERFSRRCPSAATRGQDPCQGPHPAPGRQERRRADARQSEEQGVADPRSPRRVDRDRGGRFHAGQRCSTPRAPALTSGADNSGIARRARRTRLVGRCRGRPFDAGARSPARLRRVAKPARRWAGAWPFDAWVGSASGLTYGTPFRRRATRLRSRRRTRRARASGRRGKLAHGEMNGQSRSPQARRSGG